MRFKFEIGHWYSAEIIGAFFGPDIRDYSPIQITHIKHDIENKQRIQINFYHAYYPEGVRDKQYLLETIDDNEHFYFGRSIEHEPFRYLLIYPISKDWINAHFNIEVPRNLSIEEWLEKEARSEYDDVNPPSISRDQIASKITRMVGQLHELGYENLYLYSGKSPNGMNWRYEIGICQSGQWPIESPIINESISHGSELSWVSNTESVETFANKFISVYLNQQNGAKNNYSEYVEWYKSQLKRLSAEEPLVLYADYDHEYYDEILDTAPGYKNNKMELKKILDSLDLDNLF